MKNFLILYTQTASKQIDYSISPKDYEKWTRAISISWILNNSENTKIIRPIGYNVDYETSKYIGISNETAILKGIELIVVLKQLIEVFKHVDYIVGHNIEYHLNIIKSELYRNGFENNIPNLPTICLMKYGENFTISNSKEKSKFPTLLELNKIIFNINLQDEYIPKDNYPYIASTNIFAINKCFNYMLEANVFTNIGINPTPNFFVIPFDKDYELIFKTKLINNIVYYENSILFKNVKSYKEFSKYGLSILEIDNEFILLDYRGILIFKSNKEISIESHYDFDSLEIVSDYKQIFNITQKSFYVLLHKYDYLYDAKEFSIIKNYLNQKTLIKKNGEVVFINKEIIYNKNSNLIVIKEEEFSRIYDSNFKAKCTFSTLDYDVQYIDNNYIHFLKENYIGTLNPEINPWLEKEKHVLIKPKFKYIEVLTSDYILFSNHFVNHKEKNIHEVGDYGIADYLGNILTPNFYEDISIVNNEIIGLKNGIEEKINISLL